MKLDWKFDPMSLASSYKIVGDDAVSNKKKKSVVEGALSFYYALLDSVQFHDRSYNGDSHVFLFR